MSQPSTFYRFLRGNRIARQGLTVKRVTQLYCSNRSLQQGCTWLACRNAVLIPARCGVVALSGSPRAVIGIPASGWNFGSIVQVLACPPESVVALHTSPTVLIASARIQQKPVHILVAHAPHRGHPLEVRKEWWRATSHLCLSHNGTAPWIFLIEGNCRIGSRETAAIGGHQADIEDEPGSILHDTLLRLGLCIPATFAPCMWGSGGTLFQKRSGALDRSDYVCVPRDWMDCECHAWVDPGITAGHACMDHLAALCHCAVATLGQVSRQRRSTDRCPGGLRSKECVSG